MYFYSPQGINFAGWNYFPKKKKKTDRQRSPQLGPKKKTRQLLIYRQPLMQESKRSQPWPGGTALDSQSSLEKAHWGQEQGRLTFPGARPQPSQA